MTIEADHLSALRAYLLADPEVSALVATRVFAVELPQATIEAETDIEHPSKMVVLRPSGGAGREDRVRIENSNLDVLCYGETDFEANLLRRTVADVLKNAIRVVQDNVLIHNISATGGPLFLKDPDSKWPVMFQSYRMLAATQVTT